MNEYQIKKGWVIASFILFLAIIFIQSVCDNHAIRRADTQIDTLERNLADAEKRAAQCERELEDSRRTIAKCHSSVGNIAERLGEQSEELSGIIENLKTVREEVKNMENSLNFFYIKYGLNDNNPDNLGGEIE